VRVQLLITRNSDSDLQAVTCDLDSRLVLGRDRASPACLEGLGVSRDHFALIEQAGNLLVEDLSSNGTFVNGARLPARIPSPLKTGDVIEIPGYKIEMNWGSGQSEVVVPHPVVSVAGDRLRLPLSVQEFLASLTVWEWLLIAAILCSLILIVTYWNW
jgi:pSer/pThr/pTyr-binding forkhead associated (FHA) protein